MEQWFSRLAQWTSHQAGRSHTFAVAIAIIVVWGASGPYFNYSDTWQLIINTGTTVVTFLMIFLLQSTINRDTLALNLKIDELIAATNTAHNSMIRLDALTEKELEQIKARFQSLPDSDGLRSQQ